MLISRESRDLNERPNWAPGAFETDALLDVQTRVGCYVDVSLERNTMRVVCSFEPAYPRDNASRSFQNSNRPNVTSYTI